MQYFKNLIPNITYDGEVIKNLFHTYDITEQIKDEFLTNYTMRDGESLESVSLELYGSTIYWWVIAMINDIRDVINDVPVSQETLQNYAREAAGDPIDLGLFTTTFDALNIENDAKRTLKVIERDLLNVFLSDIVREFNANK